MRLGLASSKSPLRKSLRRNDLPVGMVFVPDEFMRLELGRCMHGSANLTFRTPERQIQFWWSPTDSRDALPPNAAEPSEEAWIRLITRVSSL